MNRFSHKTPLLFLSGILFMSLFFRCSTAESEYSDAPAKKPNVLLICVDDLRPEIGSYGSASIQTPNIDALASSGFQFNRHYVQSAICGPSRSSMLLGKVSQQWDPWKAVRENGVEPERPVALPHLFKQNGYKTVGIGKITHEPGGVMDADQRIAQIPFAWDTTYTATGKWETPWRAFFAYANGDAHNTAMRIGEDTPRIPYEAGKVDDEGYPDGLNTLEAIRQLKTLQKSEQPFFLALGFYKPHLPFNAPKKYWDLYNKNEIPLADNNFLPENLNNPFSTNASPELTTHYPWPDGPGTVTEKSARTVKHGYFACISYIDAQIGKVLNELKRLRLEDNTIVILWSDHGWHLGEHTMFGKMSNFEIATRSPFIIRVPAMKKSGVKLNHLTESIDLYPTLAELCSLKVPDYLQGESLVEIMQNPNSKGPEYARSFYYRKGALGKSIRTDRYRVTRWADENDSTLAVELYNHDIDPNENTNIAMKQPDVLNHLLEQLQKVHFMDPNAPFQRGWE